MEERLAALRLELDAAADDSCQRAEIFMSAATQLKEAYVQRETRRRYGECEDTIAHLLYDDYPRFLELDARWVDALLEAEGDMRDQRGNRSLMMALMSQRLDGFNFDCKRFQALLQKQGGCVNDENRTALMQLCYYNPQLLGH